MSIPTASVDGLGLGRGPVALDSGAAIDPRKVEQLAQEFEAMFLLQVVRQMRQSILEPSEGEQGFGSGTMTDTIDVEFARYLSAAGGIGLAKSLAGHLPGLGDAGADARPAGRADVGTTTRAAVAAAAATASPLPAGAGERSPAGASHPGPTLPLDAPVSSAFGWRTDPFLGTPRFHGGIDFKAAYGREVPAAAAGRVVFAGEQGGYGHTVVVEHAGGYRTRYAHLSAVSVEAGQRLAQGAVVGRVGQSGRATGPHLHFEVTHEGKRLDPEALARAWPGGLKSAATPVDSLEDSASTPGLSTGAHDEG